MADSVGALPRLRQESLAQRAYAELKQAILSGRMPPGAVLAEVETAEALGISRTPVREALALLRRDGLVETQTGGGNVVRRMTPAEVRELFLMREALECLAVREHIARGADGEEIAALRKLILAQREAADADDVEAFLDADEELHLTIARQAELPNVAALLTSLRDKMRQAGLGAVTQQHRMRHVVREHEAIVKALRVRESTTAAAAVIAHLGATRRAFDASS